MTLKTNLKFLLKSFIVVSLVSIISCESSDYVPKPKAYLRLQYPDAKYVSQNLQWPFYFETNTLANIKFKKVKSSSESYGVNLEYPTLKGTIFLTYKSIDKDKKNLIDYLRDAQNFTQKHTIKADEIPVTPYQNYERKVYGSLAEVVGDVASPAQFYVTDSINHFLTGSLYFYTKPNYDSILPAANYLQKDIKHIMETIKWK